MQQEHTIFPVPLLLTIKVARGKLDSYEFDDNNRNWIHVNHYVLLIYNIYSVSIQPGTRATRGV